MTTNLLLVAAFVFVMLVMSYNYSKKKKKILFFGDSLTELGNTPGGYITLLRSMLKKEGADDTYELIGAGIGGNKIDDLDIRLMKDVLSRNPDLVIVFIGINDIWQKEQGWNVTSPGVFRATYDNIIYKLLSAGTRVIVCTPGLIGELPDGSNRFDAELNTYSLIIKELAAANGLLLVDVRKAFFNYNALHNIRHEEFGTVTTDRVHLNETGNRLVAEEMWKVIKEISL